MSNELQNIVAEMLDLSLEGSVVREWANRLQATLPAAGGGVGAVACGRCGGTGEISRMEKNGRSAISVTDACPNCTAPPSPPVAEAVATITGADEYGPMIAWNKHWADLVGCKLFAGAKP